MKKKIWICNKVNSTTAEILLYGFIGQYEQIDDAAFVSDLRLLESQYANIDLRINCGGGDVYKGMTIFNSIRNSSAKIVGYIDGIAASMGSVIAAACKEVHMSKYARYMTHRVCGYTGGNADDMRSMAEEMENLEDNIAGILGKRTGLEKAAAKTKYITDKDRWIGADQALTEKLVDSVYDADPVSIPNENNLQNAFDAFQQKFQNRLNTTNTDMKQLAILLGLAENATEAQLSEAITKLQAALKTAENKATEIVTGSAKTMVAAALNAGKIKAEEVKDYEDAAVANFSLTQKMLDKLPAAKRVSNTLNPADKKVGENEAGGDEPDTWEKLTAKGEKYLAEFKANNAETYNKLLHVYKTTPVTV